MWFCRLPLRIGPLGNCEFAGDFIKISASCGRTESSAPTGYVRKLSFAVGANNSVGPVGSYGFAEDFRKNSAFCRVDVGIDPYAGAVEPLFCLFRL